MKSKTASATVLFTQFEKLISAKKQNENAVQRFLEQHSELIPTPFLLNHSLHLLAVVSKLRLTKDLITDFVYLTKSSGSWWCCLVEIERPRKPIFTKDLKRVTFHSEFNKALGQLESWKCFIDGGGEKQVRDWLAPLLKVMASNRVHFKYVLVYGRRAEMEGNQERTDRWDQLSNAERRVMTYDSLISAARNDRPFKKSILSMQLKGFKLKRLNDVETPLFAFLKSHELFVDHKTEIALTKMGYQIASWRKGKLLNVNFKYTNDGAPPLKVSRPKKRKT